MRVRLKTILDHPNPDFLAVFVHGLEGHWKETWLNRKTGFLWPLELPFQSYRAYALDYPAPVFVKDGRNDFDLEEVPSEAMSLLENELRSLLLPSCKSHTICKTIPIIFICHSLGGIVVKRLVEKLYNDPERPITPLRLCRKAVIFIGTPHLGSNLATLLFRLTPSRYRSQTIAVLASMHPMARSVDDDFACTTRIHPVSCQALAELSAVGRLLHVARIDSLLHRVTPVALTRTLVREHHFSVVKPPDKDGFVIGIVQRIVDRMVKLGGSQPLTNFAIQPTNIGANYKPDPSSVDESEGYPFAGDFYVESRIACDITSINLLVEREGHHPICSAPGKSSYYNGPLRDNPEAYGFVRVDGEKKFVDAWHRLLQPLPSTPGQKLRLSISRWCRAIGTSRNESQTRSIQYWIDEPVQVIEIEYRYSGRPYREYHKFGFLDAVTMVPAGIDFQWLEQGSREVGAAIYDVDGPRTDVGR